jgi:hypothetical protein
LASALQRPLAVEAPQQRLVSQGAGVSQLYRYPGLAPSKAATLLRKAQGKASSKIVGLDAELCYNVSTTAPLTPKEADTLAW